MKTALVVGGTGTLGKQFVPLLVGNGFHVRVLSRNEHSQIEMQKRYSHLPVDYFMGDVRDYNRIYEATKDCHSVFHFAATKSVDKVEYNPYESVLTNIIGTKNVVRACQQQGVDSAVFTSTDKAVACLNCYGATKLVGEKLWIAGNVGSYKTKFAAVRYGNVFGSRGSVIEKWAAGPPYYLTDPNMTRFFMSVSSAAHLVLTAWNQMKGGEIFISKMKSTTMLSLLHAVTKEEFPEIHHMGIRPGEKMHECLYTEDEQRLVTDCGDYFIKWPSHKLFPFSKHGSVVGEGAFTSEVADKFTKEEILELCQQQ